MLLVFDAMALWALANFKFFFIKLLTVMSCLSASPSLFILLAAMGTSSERTAHCMQALSRCLAAASQQQQQQQQGEAEEGGALGLVQQLMFNLAKKGMTAANLAVRQVSVTRTTTSGSMQASCGNVVYTTCLARRTHQHVTSCSKLLHGRLRWRIGQ